MKEMWDSRYSASEYAYGIEANVFLKHTLDSYNFEGKILFPAEGEGRNAVYAAQKGMEVVAFDISEEGKKKALKLADTQKVRIRYEVGDFFKLELANEKFDVAALIYAHFPPNILAAYHQKIGSMIKPNGYIILEGYSKNNLPLRAANPAVGGPDKIEMLFSVESIRKDFPDFEIIQLEEQEVELKEGIYHNGIAKVIRFIGRKKQS
jgi:hypothetical protein